MKAGDRVRGSYMGTQFSGVVRSTRQHTINHLVTLTSVDLDEPIYIAAANRREETGLSVSTSFDGSALPPDAGDWGNDWLQAEEDYYADRAIRGLGNFHGR